MANYIPPFTITNNILEYVSAIMKKVGKLDNYKDLNKMPILRRNNRIHSIHSSLAIENNSLSFNQVKDIVNGKLVVGEKEEVQEVKNASFAYKMMMDVNPYSLKDLKKVHKVMTDLTIDDAGYFRQKNEGVFDGNICIHICPKPDMVPTLMNQLFAWLKKNKNEIHPLILSSVFHYEFVFIHPFSNGNGRMARLWQNVMLAHWENIFEYVPIESQIKEYQEDYYQAISNCNAQGNSTEFIEFMLKMIDEVLSKLIDSITNEVNHISPYVKKLLDVMDEEIALSTKDLMLKLNLKSRISFRNNYLKPALENGLIKMTNPSKPTSKNQTYYKA